MRISASFVLVLITQTLITDVSLTLWAPAVFFFPYDRPPHILVFLCMRVCFLNWISTGISGRLRNTYWKKHKRKTANQWIDLVGEFVCKCVILFVPYEKNLLYFSIVRQINCYLDFDLTSNKFSNTYCLWILTLLTMWQLRYKENIVGYQKCSQ